MIRLHSLSVEKWGLLQKPVTLPLDKYPLLVVRGQNRNAGDPQQSNAAGKSLFLSALPTIRYSAPPVSVKSRDLSGMENGTMLALEFSGTDRYRLEQSYKSSVKYKCFKNGTDLEWRTTPIARKNIEGLLPWDEDLFYSTIYLDGRRPFTFQMGTDAQRLAAFTGMFDLSHFDSVRAKLLERRRELDKFKVEHDTLQAELVRCKSILDKNPWTKEDETEWNALTSDRCKWTARWSKASTEVQRLTPLVALWDRQQQLDKHVSVTVDVKQVRRQAALHREWDKYDSDSEEYTRKRSKIHKRLRKLTEVGDPHDLEKRLAKAQKLAGQLEERVSAAERRREKLTERLTALREEYTGVAGKLAKLPKTKVQDDVDVAGERHKLNQLSKLSGLGSKCPTCGQQIDEKKIRRMVRESQVKLNAIETAIHRQELAAKVENLRVLGVELKGRLSEADKQELADVEKQAREIAGKRDQLEQLVDVARARRRLEDLEASLVPPKEPDGPRPACTRKELEEQYAQYQKQRKVEELRNQLREELETLTGEPVLESRPDLEAAVARQAKAHKALQKVNEFSRELEGKRAQHKMAARNLKELQAKVKVSDQALTDIPVLDGLIAAYGNKGLKVSATQRIASMVEESLNDRARLIFPEPVTFRLEVTEGRFSVSYTIGKRTADVQRLSGAESRQFALLFLSARLPLIPSHLRTNLLVLDEMDANMSDATRQTFVHDFLPYMQTLVPNIVVVTPDLRTSYQGAHVIKVVKQGTTSTVRGL